MSSTTPNNGSYRNPSSPVNPSPSSNAESPGSKQDQERAPDEYDETDPHWEKSDVETKTYEDAQRSMGLEVNDFTIAP